MSTQRVVCSKGVVGLQWSSSEVVVSTQRVVCSEGLVGL